MGFKGRVLVGLLLAGLMSGCGEATVFFFFNTGPLETEGAVGGVVVVGTAIEPPPQEVRLLSGNLPEGMEVMDNGTVQGIPEESGEFDFTLAVTHSDGTVEEKHYELVLEE